MLAGVVAIVGAAGLTLAPRGGPSSSEPVPASVPAANAHALGPLAVTLSGPGDVTVLTQAYEPGGDSGWHAHPGIHAVAVLSGTLTVYDEECRPQTFGPGQPYIGGQEPHRVRNEAQEPVQMVVTYLNPAGPHNSNRSVPAPAACGTAG
jgi:quercetin dioxygenase-like cupin family protein